MLDDSLKDYWLNICFYRTQPKLMQKMLLAGQLAYLADHDANRLVRKRLSEFIFKEKEKAA